MIPPFTLRRDEYQITTDRNKLDLAVVHDYLCNHSYWTPGVSLEKVRMAADHSLNFSLFHLDRQIGYARVITDYCQIAYLGDVFVLDEYQGRGLGVWLIETVHSHPQLLDLRNWLLGTRDAHDLYRKFGWIAPPDPQRWMIRPNTEVNGKT